MVPRPVSTWEGEEESLLQYTCTRAGDLHQGGMLPVQLVQGCSIYRLSPKSPQSPGAWQDAPTVPYKYVYVYIDF